ncbi:hypothetical protein [Portibacter lacus]|uniref:Uncharacterized protein n=1 Tax=Portibacter lacus TaxID=1099794 RepID=A0AA37WB96_9BACT|nr:hypothetical protein [Portibacter lacus]GLR15401.1 hypothetical protein GCM10007940_00160 [Portibacter lacus]
MKLIVFFSLCFLTLQIQAQLESPFEKGAELLGIGNAGTGYSGHYALLYNQAGIADAEELSFSVDGARLFNDSGLLHLHAAAVIPTKKLGTFGLKIQRYGLEGFNYQNYALTYSRALFKSFKLAATFNAYQFQIENYGNSFEPNMEIGVLTDLSDKVSLGVHVSNPFPLQISENTDFPTVFSAGILYKVSKVVRLYADIEKNIRQRENIKVGIDYDLHSSFSIRVGMNTFPGSFYFGCKVKLTKIAINLGNGYHPVLGNSTGIGIIYSAKS